MVKARSELGIGSCLLAVVLAVSFMAPQEVPVAAAQGDRSPVAEARARPPVVVGVAIDETAITPGDLQRSQELVLALVDALPEGSEIALASFSAEQRILLSPTSDRRLLIKALAGFKAGVSGVALPDGLFDMVEYLTSRDADSRAVLLLSAGRVREGDLQFEDPLNAAANKGIPIFAVALGQGDGRLLRRIAKLTGGEYVRLEVADASMLAYSMAPRSEGTPIVSRNPDAASSPAPREPRRSRGLLGAAAIFMTLGGVLLLGIVVLLVRRLGVPFRKSHSPAPNPPNQRSEGGETRAAAEGDDVALERTLVINADPILRALSGPGAGKNFPLSPAGPTSIGRSRRNDVVVPEDAASAQHCRIDREGDSYVLHDLGATNGTWVNGAQTQRAVLQHGDRLKIGETVFMVSLFGDRS